MNKYTIYCTPSQAKKALELGAPIQKASIKDIRLERYVYIGDELFTFPTAEEMAGWLEERGVYVETKVNQRTDGVTNFVYNVICGSYSSLNNEVIFFDTRKEAILAAIDAALEYLVNSDLIK